MISRDKYRNLVFLHSWTFGNMLLWKLSGCKVRGLSVASFATAAQLIMEPSQEYTTHTGCIHLCIVNIEKLLCLSFLVHISIQHIKTSLQHWIWKMYWAVCIENPGCSDFDRRLCGGNIKMEGASPVAVASFFCSEVFYNMLYPNLIECLSESHFWSITLRGPVF